MTTINNKIIIVIFLFLIYTIATIIVTYKLKEENNLRKDTIEKLLLENKKLLEENIYLKEKEYILSLSIKDSLLYEKIKSHNNIVDSAIHFFRDKSTKD